MKLQYWLAIGLLIVSVHASGQLIYYKNQIYSPYTIKDDKAERRNQKLVDDANALNSYSLDSNEAEIESALWAVSQFLVRTPESDKGVEKLVRSFSQLSGRMQRSLMEVLYGLYPHKYAGEVSQWLRRTSDPKLFAQAASYLYQHDARQGPALRQQLRTSFPSFSSSDLLNTLDQYLASNSTTEKLPALDSLFAYQQVHKFKVVYSFQRTNRDFPGLAVVQQSDGTFAKDSTGQIRSFVQLARSASNLPYFLTNGSTPQGLYAITGTAVSRNVFIGPTPNLQMVMMHEVNTPKFTHYFPIVFNAPPEKIYRSYFPPSWQQWSGLMEAYEAGKIGRSEIIAHGTTINPEWFNGKPYYPISPTLGCLCGREIWDGKTGRIEYSDQLELVNTFIETPGTKGYLIVINIDDKAAPVTLSEIAPLVQRFEKVVLPVATANAATASSASQQ